MKNQKILVTGANGNTGFHAAKELLALGFPVRAFVRNANGAKAKNLESLGAEIFVGNMNDIRDVRGAMKGVKRAYYVPPFAPNALFTGITFAVAAEQMSLEHVVSITQWFASNLHPSLTTKEHWLNDQVGKMSPNVEYIFINPSYAFPFVYFQSLELIAQFGIMPDMGTNAPVSNEDMGAVAAHILKNPKKHEGKSYRPTGPKMLSAQDLADIVGNVLDRKVKAQKMSRKMFQKALKSGGFPIYAFSQIPIYNEEAYTGTMKLGGPTSVVKDIVGREPESFKTIAERYIVGNPLAKQTLRNKLRAVKNLVKTMVTIVSDIEKYQREEGQPHLENTEFASQNREWLDEHENQHLNYEFSELDAAEMSDKSARNHIAIAV